MDVIVEINLVSFIQHKYILTITGYFTKLVEVFPLTQINEKKVINLIEKYLITRF